MSNTVSVIIPCYNEWARVADLVHHVFSVFHNEVQVIVSDQSKDQIIFSSLEYYFNNHNLHMMKDFIYTKSFGHCRAETMNQGANFATGDIVLFLHADNQLPIQAYEELKRIDLHMYCGWWFLKLYSPITFWTSIMTTFWNMRRMRSKQFFWDNAIWCSRKVFESLWWFPKMKLFEDVKFSQMMSDYAFSHKKGIFVSNYPTITSSRKYIEWWFRTIFRIQMKLQILYKLGLYTDEFQNEYYKK